MISITHVKERKHGYSVRFIDGSERFIPHGHRWERAVVDWIAQGNTPEPIETPQEKAERTQRKAKDKHIQDARDRLKSPVQSISLASLSARIEDLEIALGLREPT